MQSSLAGFCLLRAVLGSLWQVRANGSRYHKWASFGTAAEWNEVISRMTHPESD